MNDDDGNENENENGELRKGVEREGVGIRD